MAKPIVIIGSSEIARMAYEYFSFDSKREVAGFAVEQAFLQDDRFEGLPLVSYETVLEHYPPDLFDGFVAIGSGQLNRLRGRFFSDMKLKGYTLASYVSSRAFVWRDVSIGENCLILEGNILQSGVRIGDNVILWSGNHIGHRSRIGNHVFIASHVVISGLCSVGDHVFMGVNSAVAEEVSIAEDNFVAMSAAVTRSSSPDQLLAGNPAEPAKVGAKRFCRVKAST